MRGEKKTGEGGRDRRFAINEGRRHLRSDATCTQWDNPKDEIILCALLACPNGRISMDGNEKKKKKHESLQRKVKIRRSGQEKW